MKILQVIPHLASGGAERFVVDLSNELVCLGYQVTLLVLYNLEDKYGFYKNELNKKITIITLGKKNGLSLKCFWQVIKVIKKIKPDIIHSHINSLQYVILPQLFFAKGVHTIHNEAHLETTNSLEVFLRKIVFRLNLVQPVTISNESQNSFKTFYGKDAPLIYNGRLVNVNIIVPNSIKKEINSYRSNCNSRLIIQIARFQPQKNLPMMARVAMRLFNEGYNFTLLMIGDTNNEEIASKVESLLPPCAYILGERKNVIQYLKEADAFALSSKFEGLPISLLEALAAGAVPICTPVGGIPNIVIDGKNGFLSFDCSEDSYYLAMRRFLDTDDSKLNIMSKNAQKSFMPFSMEKCAKKYSLLYQKLLS